MSQKTFSISIPVKVYDLLKGEADQEIRSLNQQINVILRDRYNAHAPPAPIKSSRALPRVRKQKTKAEAN